MPNKSLDHKIFLATLPVVIVFLLVSIVENYALNLYFLSVVTLISAIYFLVIYKVAIDEKYYKIFFLPSIIFPILICACIWFYSDGIQGSTTVVLFLLFVFFMCIVKLKNHVWLLVVMCLLITILSFTEYYFPESIQKSYNSETDRFIDVYVTTIMSFIGAYFLIGLIIKNYVIQKKIVEAQREELQLQSNKLEELNDLKDKLFSVISHDIKTPIISIKSVLELLNTSEISKEEFNRLLPEMIRNIDSTSMLMDNTLHWVKDQMVGNKSVLEKFDLAEFVSKNISQLITKTTEKNIEIINELKESFYVKADKEMLNLVLRNLLLNAIKFSNRGGVIYINANRNITEIEICIADNGVGMNNEKLKSLFQNNIHIAAIGTENEKGSGLGLLLCKDFIEKSNGRVWAESTLGKGSKFFFSLPAVV